MPNQYSFKAVLIAPDGASVTDFRNCNTVKECEDKIADMGSRWIFYPYVLVVNEVTEKVRATNYSFLDFLINWKIDDAKQYIKDNHKLEF